MVKIAFNSAMAHKALGKEAPLTDQVTITANIHILNLIYILEDVQIYLFYRKCLQNIVIKIRSVF